MNMTLAPMRKAKGSVLVVTALSLLVILGMAGLAIDLGHSFSNKTRLQNSVDAAALSAAMKLLEDLQNNIGSNTPVTTANANTAGEATHQANLTSFGSQWLTSPADIEFCWTKNLQDFSNCQSIASFSSLTANADTVFFVRARVSSTAIGNFIMQLVPGIGPTRSVGAVAVAGTIGHLYDCNIAPFYVCDHSPNTNFPDTNCTDGQCFGNPVTNDPSAPPDPTHFFGIKMGSHNDLPAVSSSCTPGTNGCVWVQDKASVNATPSNVVIPKTASQWNFNNDITFNGNRLLLNLYDINGQSSGASDVRKNIIIPTACIDPSDADTQPGNVSSIDKAINTLFGQPPQSNQSVGLPGNVNIANYYDYVTDNPISFRYYKLEYDDPSNAFSQSNSRYHQRIKSVPVVKCDSTMGGNKTDLTINGYACFFLSRKMYNNSETGKLKNNEDFIIAEHIDNNFCPPITGVHGGDPDSILDSKIVLFESYETSDS